MKTVVVGIDEAGRGPLAGPVCVGCVRIVSPAVKKVFPKIRDSKQLSPQRREEWFQKIQLLQKEGALSYTTMLVSARVIDTKGITTAIQRGIISVLKKTHVKKEEHILLDGGLRAPRVYTKQKTIIKGDEKELSIALASIVAKVTRDRYMTRAAKKYPAYGFEVHKGYGTQHHIQILGKKGYTPLHRRTFCRILTKDV